jgi:hypothetical protein
MPGECGFITPSPIWQVSAVFINFPEPPSGYLGLESASNELHLLTASFFADVHRVLLHDGHLTITSDNGRYCRALCATLGALRRGAGGADGALLFTSERLHGARELSGAPHGGHADGPTYEMVSGVRLYHGMPGSECGHLQATSSYFDRLWEYRQVWLRQDWMRVTHQTGRALLTPLSSLRELVAAGRRDGALLHHAQASGGLSQRAGNKKAQPAREQKKAEGACGDACWAAVGSASLTCAPAATREPRPVRTRRT